MAFRKKRIALILTLCMLASLLPGFTAEAAEYYDMRYFRFLASEYGEGNLPQNVRVQDKKWTTGDAQKAGDYFIIDMYQELETGKVVLNQPREEYPAKYSVYISTKMEDFGEPILSGVSGSESAQTVIDFPVMETVRFIKIVLDAGTEENTNPWSIQSLKVYHANNAVSKAEPPKVEKKQYPSLSEIHAAMEQRIGIGVDTFDGTRGSFAVLLAAFAKRPVSSVVKGTCYTDINASVAHAGEIEAISDWADGATFYPENQILLDDAVEWILKALGYAKTASYLGEGESGYRDLANRLGLLKKVGVSYGQALDQTALTELFYNALMTPTALSDEAGKNTPYDYAAYLWHDVIEIDGNVVSSGYTSRSGAPLVSPDYVMIGDEVYYDGDALASDYLGLHVIAYIQKEDASGHESAVIYAAPKPNRNNVTVIPGENLISGSLSELRYTEDPDSDRVKRIALDRHPDMIYNGKGCTPIKEEKLAGIQNGYLTAVDSDNNGRADLVIVEEYVDYFVSYVDKKQMIVSDMYGNPGINFSDHQVKNVSVYKKGERVSFDAVRQKSILSIAADETTVDASGAVRIDANRSTLYKIYVSEESFEGAVTSISVSDEIYAVDGIEFKSSDSFQNAVTSGHAMKPSLGRNYTFYVNDMGKIAAVEALTDVSVTYGLLVQLGSNDDNILKKQVEMKVVMTTGKVRDFVAAEKVRIDGIRERFDEDRAKALFCDDVTREVYDSATSSVITVTDYQLIPQVIGFTRNEEGEIISIDTRNYNAEEGDKYQTLGHRAPEQYTCNIYRGMIYPTANGSTSPNMNYGSAVLFVGPSDVSSADVEKDYEVYNGTYFQHDAKYKLEIFKCSEFNSLEIGFIHGGASGSASATADEYVLVNEMFRQLNKDGEVVTGIEGLQGGKRFAADLYSDDVLQGLTLKRGDLIAVGMNQRGQIITVKSIFDVDNKDSVLLSNNGKYYQERRTTVGKVYKASGSSLMITSTKAVTDSDAEDALELFNLPGLAMVYDEANDEVRSATKEDIKAYKGVYSDSLTSLVFALTTWGENKSFVIYNFE